MLQGRIMRWCGGLAVSLAIATPAAAQDDAPKVAPDSPAGTEYQLPVDHARDAGSGGGSSHSSGTPGAAPLFGAGVVRRTSRPATRRRHDGSVAPARTKAPAGHQTARPASTPATIRARAAAPDSGGGGLLAIGAGAAGVLLIGGLAGLALRQRPAIPDTGSHGVTREH
jgi:hypothetical protein